MVTHDVEAMGDSIYLITVSDPFAWQLISRRAVREKTPRGLSG